MQRLCDDPWRSVIEGVACGLDPRAARVNYHPVNRHGVAFWSEEENHDFRGAGHSNVPNGLSGKALLCKSKRRLNPWSEALGR
jgi:hypothetical protein